MRSPNTLDKKATKKQTLSKTEHSKMNKMEVEEGRSSNLSSISKKSASVLESSSSKHSFTLSNPDNRYSFTQIHKQEQHVATKHLKTRNNAARIEERQRTGFGNPEVRNRVAHHHTDIQEEDSQDYDQYSQHHHRHGNQPNIRERKEKDREDREHQVGEGEEVRERGQEDGDDGDEDGDGEENVNDLLQKEESQNKYSVLGLFARCPCFFIIIMYLVAIMCAFWIWFNDLYQYTTTNERDFLIFNQQNKERELYDAVYLAELETQTQDSEDEVALRTQVYEPWTTQLIFQAKDSDANIFTERNIIRMRQIADALYNMEDIQNFCLAESAEDGSCSDREFMRGAIFDFGENTEDYEIKATLKEMSSNIDMQQYFSNKFTIANPVSRITRVIYTFGMPIETEEKRYLKKEDDLSAQDEAFEELTRNMASLIESLEDPDMDIYIFSENLYQLEYLDEIWSDVEFTIGCGVFLFLYMVFHFRSLFMSLFSISSVALSIPISYVLYSDTLGVKYVGILHIISIYVILGISTENMFVFHDAWRHSKMHTRVKYQMHKRLKYTLSKSLKPIAMSTFITFCGFFAVGFCGIIPIATLGIAMALLILVNFGLLLINFPCGLIFYSKYIEKACDCNDCIKKIVQPFEDPKFDTKPTITKTKLAELEMIKMLNENDSSENNSSREPSLSRFSKTPSKHTQKSHKSQKSQKSHKSQKSQKSQKSHKSHKSLKSKHSHKSHFSHKSHKKAESSSSSSISSVHIIEEVDYGLAESSLGKILYTIIKSPMKFVLILVLLVWVGVNIWGITEIKGISGPEEFLPERFQVTVARRLVKREFRHGPNDFSVRVRLVWGIKGVDREGLKRFDPASYGQVVWDQDFSIKAKESQLKIRQICYQLTNEDELLRDEQSVSCFYEDFYQYVVEKYAEEEDNHIDVDVVAEAHFLADLYDFSESVEGGHYKREYEIGFDQERNLKFVQIIAASKEDPYTEVSEMENAFLKWEDFKDSLNEDLPEGMNNMFQTAMYSWAFLKTGPELIENAVIGLTVSLAVAFVGMLLFTMNLLIAIMALFSLTFLFLSIIGSIFFCGYEFGLIESILSVVIVGYVINYTTLIAGTYATSPHKKRQSRTKDVLMKVGFSIFEGAAATVGSTIFLYVCVFLIMEKFAIMVLFSILYSLVFSILFFLPLLHFAGPQQHNCDIRSWCCKKYLPMDNLEKIPKEFIIEEGDGVTQTEEKMKMRIRQQTYHS